MYSNNSSLLNPCISEDKNLVVHFSENLDRKIIVPEFDGKPGHPVVFPESRFDELARLSGDHGAKKLIANHRSDVLRITVDDPGSIRDLDTLSE